MAGSSADIGIRIFLDDAAGKGLGAIDQNLQMLGRDAISASGAFKLFGTNLVGLGLIGGVAASFAIFAVAIGKSVEEAIKFQTILIQMGRAGSLTNDQMQQLGQTLMDVGGHSIFSIEELGQAFVTLLQRGIKANDIIHGVGQQAVYLAEATGMQAVPAAQLLASTMVAFNIPASQAAKTVDLLQFAIEHGIGPSATLASAMSTLGSIAGVLKLSLSDVIPAFDILTRATGSYSQAATTLQYYLNQVKFGTKTYRDEIQALGISFYDSKGNFVGMDQSLQILYDRVKGMNTKQLSEVLGSLFNVRSGKGVALLLKDLGDVYGLTEKLKTSHDNLGQSMMRAQQAEQSAAGLWQSLKSNLQDFLTLAGGPFLAILQPVLSNLNNLSIEIRKFAAANPLAVAQFMALGLAVSGLAVVAIIISLFGTVIVVIAGVVAAVMALDVGIMWMAAHWNQVLGVLQIVGKVLLGVGAAIALVVAYDQALNIALAVKAFIAAVPGIIAFTVALVTQTIPAIIASIARFAALTVATIIYAVTNMTTLIPALIATTIAWIAAAAPVILLAGGILLLTGLILGMIIGLGLLIAKMGGMTVLLNIAKAAWAAIWPVLQMVGNEIKGAFLQALEQLKPVWAQLIVAFNQAKPALLVLGQILGGVLLIALGIIIGLVIGLAKALGAVVVAIVGVIAGFVKVISGIIQLFTGFFTVLHGLVTGNGAEIQAGFKTMGQGIVNIFTGMWQMVKSLWVGVFQAITGFVSGFIGGIVSFFSHLANTLVGHSIIPDMLQAILSAFRNILGNVLSFIFGWVGNLIIRFGMLELQGLSIILNMMNGMRNHVVSGLNAIVGAVVSGFATIVVRVINAGFSVINSVQSAWNGARNAAAGGINGIVGLAASLPGRIIGAISWLGGAMFSWGINAMSQFANGLGAALGAVVSKVQQAASAVANFLGHHSPAKMGPLSHDDEWMPNMMKMFATGIESHTPLLHKASSNAASGIAGASGFAKAGSGYGSGGGGGGGGQLQPITLTLDGKVIAQCVVDNVTGQMQMNGLGRAFR